MITVLNQQEAISIDTDWLTAVADHLLHVLNYQGYDLGILLTSNEEMGSYNETYRHKKGPTDILSFAYHELSPGERIRPLTEEDKNLGDLILAPAYIHTYTVKEKIPFEHRLLILLIHGLCHVLGYDHETDEDYVLMHTLEKELLMSLPQKLQR